MDTSLTYAVTGAASGIGRATALLLARRGAKVFALDVDVDGLHSVAAMAPEIVAVGVDLTSPQSVEAAGRTISSGTTVLDGLVNCAGLIRCGALVEIPESEMRTILEVNVLGVYRTTRALYPLLRERKGRVVNVSSEVARVTSPFNGPYSMTKYAIESYSDALRRELAAEGIRVVIVQPGAVRTALLRSTLPAFDRAIEGSRFERPMRRIRDLASKEWDKAAEPATVARVILRALTARKPALRYRVHNDPVRRAAGLLPARWLDYALARVLKS